MRILLLILLVLPAAWGEVLHVPGEFGTIQGALDATSPGDTVLVANGTYVELLSTPVWEVTLASHYIFSEDTTDIQETILDGDYQGTVLDVYTETPSVFHLRGFTIQHGEGYFNAYWDYRPGGFFLQSDVSIDFQDLVFRHNRGYRAGGAVTRQARTSATRVGSFSLQRVHIHDNEMLEAEPYAWCFRISMEGTGVVEDLVVEENTGSNGHQFIADAGLQLARVTMEGGAAPIFNRVAFDSDANTTARDVRVQNCFNVSGGVLRIQGDTLVARNIYISDNLNQGTDNGNANSIYGVSYLDIDSLYIQRNRVFFQGDGAGTVSSYDGTVRNLHVTDNVVGDSLVQDARGMIFEVNNVDVIDSEFSRNVILNGPVEGGEAPWSGNVVSSGAGRDTVRWRNCRFEDNFTHDPDDYSQIQNPRPNIARALLLNSGNDNEYIEMRDCVFRNNRQPNHAPEWAGMDLWHRSVGSTVEFVSSGPGKHYELHNILMEDCDDGGIWIDDGPSGVIMNQVVVRRTNRFAVQIVGPDTLSMVNCLFEDITEQDNYIPFPYTDSYQDVLTAGVVPGETSLHNVTVTNCSMSKLFTGPLDFRNSIVWGNDYDVLSDQWYEAPEFSTSIVQPGMTGSNNTLEDPLFDEELGVPYLSPASPAIDAGNPDPIYNDLEDPERPGFALWPSQGGLRNDIGYTGGPHAGTLDHLVRVSPRPEDRLLRPASLELLPNYPNPFNNQTRLEYVLPTAGSVSIRLYDIQGRMVNELFQGNQAVGRHQVLLRGEGLASGVYFVQVEARGVVEVEKVLLLK